MVYTADTLLWRSIKWARSEQAQSECIERTLAEVNYKVKEREECTVTTKGSHAVTQSFVVETK